MAYSSWIMSSLGLSSAAGIALTLLEGLGFAPFSVTLPISGTQLGQLAVIYLTPLVIVMILHEVMKIVTRFRKKWQNRQQSENNRNH